MKKITAIFLMIFALSSVVLSSGCTGNSTKTDNTTSVQQTEIATQGQTENTTVTQATDEQTENIDKTNTQNDTNAKVTVKEIDTVMIKQEYLDQMTLEGVYGLDDGNQLAIVFVNKDGYEYDTEVYSSGYEVFIHYETERSDDIEPKIDDDAYLVNGYEANTMIKIYKDGKETDFVSVIPCENIFK